MRMLRDNKDYQCPQSPDSRWLREPQMFLAYQAGCHEAELLRCQESRQRSITLASILENQIISMHCLNFIELANGHRKPLFLSN